MAKSMSNPVVGFWTAEKVKRLFELWGTVETLQAIGEELGCHRGAVQSKARRSGLPKRGTPHERGRVRSARSERRRSKVKVIEARPQLPIEERVVRKVMTHGSARNPGFNYFTAPRKSKTELMEMLRQAVENTK